MLATKTYTLKIIFNIMIGYVEIIEDRSELENIKKSDNSDTNTSLVYEE